MLMSKEESMIKIGELSSITKVPIQTIRYYESEGLISPIEVDQWTNYRYYDYSSVKRLSEIVYLKDLVMSLKEIRDLSEEVIAQKIVAIKQKLQKLKQDVIKLSSIRKKGEKFMMKSFIDDDRVVGKWQQIGLVKEKSDFKQGKILDEDWFHFPEIYFLPKGGEYWVFSWTKGTLYLKDRALPYEIEDGIMYVSVVGALNDDDVDCIAVYKKVDDKVYTIDQIRIRDNTNFPFINDKSVIGFWESVDFVRSNEIFTPQKSPAPISLWIKKLIFEPEGKLIIEYKNGDMRNLEWTKGVVLDKANETACAYHLQTFEEGDYLIMEFKSGDYSFGGQVKGSYVFKKKL